MIRFVILSILPFVMVQQSNAQPGDRVQDLRDVIAAERAFRADVARLGVRDGFLAHLADEGILFRPNAVNGPAFLRTQEPSSGLLEWEPAYADVSDAGDLGFTTGPWTYRESAADTVIASGFYATVWRRDGTGTFKAMIDHGVGLGRLQPVPEPQTVTSPTVPLATREPAIDVDVGGRVVSRAAASALLQSERELARKFAAPDGLEVLLRTVRDDGWFLRRNELPLKGKSEIESYLRRVEGRLELSPIAGYVGRSGDLGYTHGSYNFAGADGSPVEKGNYLRLWRKDADGWKIQFEVLAPLPPPGPAKE